MATWNNSGWPFSFKSGLVRTFHLGQRNNEKQCEGINKKDGPNQNLWTVEDTNCCQINLEKPPWFIILIKRLFKRQTLRKKRINLY